MNFYLSFAFDLGSSSQGIEPEQWDDFVTFVHDHLVEHPITQADMEMALLLGSTVSYHYDTWQGQGTNMAKSFRAKVSYLLNYWRMRMNHSSMKAMAMDLDKRLKKEPSFNNLRAQIKQQYT